MAVLWGWAFNRPMSLDFTACAWQISHDLGATVFTAFGHEMLEDGQFLEVDHLEHLPGLPGMMLP